MSEERHPVLELPKAERVDYLVVMASLAAVDGEVSSPEIENLRRACKNLDLSGPETGQVLGAAEEPNATEVRKILGRMSNGQSRFTLVTDMLFLAHADGNYCDRERAEIGQVAGQLDVNDEQVAALERYVAAVLKADRAKGASGADLKNLGGEVAAALASTGVPIGAVAVSGSVFGLSAAGITSGLAALGLGFGMTTGLGVAVGIGVGSYSAVKWLYNKVVES